MVGCRPRFNIQIRQTPATGSIRRYPRCPPRSPTTHKPIVHRNCGTQIKIHSIIHNSPHIRDYPTITSHAQVREPTITPHAQVREHDRCSAGGRRFGRRCGVRVYQRLVRLKRVIVVFASRENIQIINHTGTATKSEGDDRAVARDPDTLLGATFRLVGGRKLVEGRLVSDNIVYVVLLLLTSFNNNNFSSSIHCEQKKTVKIFSGSFTEIIFMEPS